MLLVLSSLDADKVDGVSEWRRANVLAIVALLLFAGRGVLPDLLSIELANAIFLGTITLIYAGFRRHLGLGLPRLPLLLGSVGAFAGVLFFHYALPSQGLRVTSVSVYHSGVCFAIWATLPRSVDPRLRYPYSFTRNAAFALGLGHAWRGAFYLVDAFMPVTLLDAATWNLVFFAIGTLALPALTLGAVMMANARVLADTAWAAEHDHLTGAPTRRAFFDVAARELARAERSKGSLGLLLVDADHFKRINDTYGHGVGDQVLRNLVERTGAVIRKNDYFARLGGEEFGVLLPDTGREAAVAAAERLRMALDSRSHGTTSQAGVAYTVSIGMAMLEDGESFASLMARADQALYAAKAGGRNRVVCAEGGTEQQGEASGHA
ncbi:GGDEF domain-containing protein [Massilia yuzhufengensis]|nr:GGDEF domain-containing protein [Massilia yuzhufengensis]